MEDISIEHLKELQDKLFKEQCDLDIRKAMVKHFIKQHK